MATTMTRERRVLARNLGSPDETRRSGDKGVIQLVNLEGMSVARARLEPGWRWSEHAKPEAGTDSCESCHCGYVISGRLLVKQEDGTERELRAGDAYTIPPRHDAWVVGDEPFVALDFGEEEEDEPSSASEKRIRKPKGKAAKAKRSTVRQVRGKSQGSKTRARAR